MTRITRASVCILLTAASTMEAWPRSKVGKTVGSLGDYLREQRTRVAALPAAARRAGRRLQPLPEPDRARSAPALGRGAPADRQGAADLRRAALHPRRDRQPRGRASAARWSWPSWATRPDRAPEAVPAGRLRVVPRPQRPAERDAAPDRPGPRRATTTREGARHGQGQVRHQDRQTRPSRSPLYAGVGVTDLAVELVRDSSPRPRSASPACRRT